MDNADPWLEGRAEPNDDPLRGEASSTVNPKSRIHKNLLTLLVWAPRSRSYPAGRWQPICRRVPAAKTFLRCLLCHVFAVAAHYRKHKGLFRSGLRFESSHAEYAVTGIDIGHFAGDA